MGAVSRIARCGWMLGLLVALAVSACGGDGQADTPAPPANQRFIPGNSGGSVLIEWDHSLGAETYSVYHSTRADSGCRLEGDQPQGCTLLRGDVYEPYVLVEHTGGEDQFYWVVACNAGGCSQIDSENPAQPPPPAPEQIQAVLQEAEVRISWELVPDATQYDLYQCDEDDWCRPIQRSITELSAVHRLPGPETPVINVVDRSEDSLALRWLVVHGGSVELRYQVAACIRSNCSTVGEGQKSATVSYVEVGRYELRRRSTDGQFAVLRDDVTQAQYIDEGLQPSTVYYYTVRYCNNAGCSPLADETGGLTEAEGPVDPPPMPSGFRGEKIDISGGGDDARVSWLTADGATWYEVHQGPALDAQISAPQTSHYDAQPNRALFGAYVTTSYRVRACNKAGCSSFTNFVTMD